MHRFGYSVCVRTMEAILFFQHVLLQTPKTDVHTKNHLPRYAGSGLKVCGGGGWVVVCKPNLVISLVSDRTEQK